MLNKYLLTESQAKSSLSPVPLKGGTSLVMSQLHIFYYTVVNMPVSPSKLGALKLGSMDKFLQDPGTPWIIHRMLVRACVRVCVCVHTYSSTLVFFWREDQKKKTSSSQVLAEAMTGIWSETRWVCRDSATSEARALLQCLIHIRCWRHVHWASKWKNSPKLQPGSPPSLDSQTLNPPVTASPTPQG